jgi:predicted nucleic acid-binding protein
LLAAASKRQAHLFLSSINLGEVFYRVGRVKGESEAVRVWDAIGNFPVTIVPAPNEAVLAAARFKMRYPISYADAFAAATTDSLGATLVTGDPELAALAGRIRIERLRRGP